MVNLLRIKLVNNAYCNQQKFELMRLLLVLACLIPVLAMADPMPPIDPGTPLYTVKVEPGVTYDDVVTSLKVAAEGKNFVSPAVFPIGQHIKERGLPLQGIIEVRSYCSLGIGAEILMESPEFAVFAPCRIAIYEKQGQLYLSLDRPTYALKHIKDHSQKAAAAAQEIEDTLIWMMDKARKGDI
jgi:uncharacterized protein (DUF302 family)